MKQKKQITKLKKHKKKMNIGIVIFLFLLIYLIILAVNYLTKSHLRIYEVKNERLAQDNVVTGLILREEEVIFASDSGFINYYFQDNAKAKKGAMLFSIDETKDYYDYLSNQSLKNEINLEEANELTGLIDLYREKQDKTYSSLIQFSNEASELVQDFSNRFSIDLHTKSMETNSFDRLHTYYSKDSGLISYNTDLLSGIRQEEVTADTFLLAKDYAKYEKRKSIVEKNTPIIKYITNDAWDICCELNEGQKKSLSTLSKIEFIICEDGFHATAPFDLIEIDKKPFAMIHMNQYVQNYLNHRFLSVELCWQASDGFKIPLSSITQKEFFVVPIQYFTRATKENALGLMVEEIDPNTGIADYVFRKSTIYFDDGLYYYIDPSEFSFGQQVLYPDNFTMYTIELKESLEGVYNINKGYALFRRIERITQNDEYCLVKTNTEYGLKLYDHIALNAKDAVDSGIIY